MRWVCLPASRRPRRASGWTVRWRKTLEVRRSGREACPASWHLCDIAPWPVDADRRLPPKCCSLWVCKDLASDHQSSAKYLLNRGTGKGGQGTGYGSLLACGIGSGVRAAGLFWVTQLLGYRPCRAGVIRLCPLGLPPPCTLTLSRRRMRSAHIM